ncbi:MAG: ion channel [Actinomycetota bacterium]
MSALAVVVGIVMVVGVLADMINTLVTTTTSTRHWWMSSLLYRRTWELLRLVGSLLPRDSAREMLFATYAPVSVLVLLVAWVTQQVIGYGLIWWGLGGVEGSSGLFEAIYYSGVVYFTLGFGEVVPVDVVPRVGSLVEAMSGVLTTALVIGYLPALYAAYSERERKLMTLDDGTEGRITPTNLLLSRAPTADVDDVLAFFDGWEDWVTGVIETHSAFPMLRMFRSKHPGQNWITAVGLLCDAALQCQIIVGARDKAPYWVLRRSILLLNELTAEFDLGDYRARLDKTYASADEHQGQELFRQLYETLENHGFELIEFAEARAETLELRRLYDAQLEFLIDAMVAPRGFWGHTIGHRVQTMIGRGEPVGE